jgi:pyruvate,water dikinase
MLHALVGMALGPEKALSVVDGLLAGCETKTALVNSELHEMARLAARTPALHKDLVDSPGQTLWETGKLESFPDFACRLRRFLDDHGHREMDWDSYHPTWVDQPGIVLDAVGLILRNGAGEDPAEVARQHRQHYAETEHRFLAELPAELRFFFRELIRLTRTYTTLDDMEHYQTTRAHPLARRAALAIGRLLQERGILDRPEDVFFFRKADLEQLAASHPVQGGAHLRNKVYAAKESYEASRRETPPWSLDESRQEARSATADQLRGLPGSPGRATGPCFLVRTPDDFAHFPKAAILVARTTNPAWTPLFYSSAGLITESGGPLSHGAVTAREMHLPAVMSVRGVMALLRNGQVVTVDGSQGIVEWQNH